MANVMSNIGVDVQRTFPFMRLPPEIRLVVYEFAIQDRLNDITRTKHLTTDLRMVPGSFRDYDAMVDARAIEAVELVCKHTCKGAPYFGALALLHTSKSVFWESCDIMHWFARRSIVHCRRTCEHTCRRMSQAKLDGDKSQASTESYWLSHERASLQLVQMVDTSFQLTRNRFLENFKSMILHGKLDGQEVPTAYSTAALVGPCKPRVCVRQGAWIMASLSHIPDIFAGIQRRLGDGVGVRASLKAEVRFAIGWDITNDDVDDMIKGIAKICAPLNTRRGLRSSDRPGSYRESKRVSSLRSRSKQFKQ